MSDQRKSKVSILSSLLRKINHLSHQVFWIWALLWPRFSVQAPWFPPAAGLDVELFLADKAWVSGWGCWRHIAWCNSLGPLIVEAKPIHRAPLAHGWSKIASSICARDVSPGSSIVMLENAWNSGQPERKSNKTTRLMSIEVEVKLSDDVATTFTLTPCIAHHWLPRLVPMCKPTHNE